MKKDQFLTKIHGLRGISIILVLFFHFYEKVFTGGYLGVDIFFVISGYIVTYSNSKYWPETRQGILKYLENFYSHRIARLLPVGILISTLSLFLGLYFSSLGETKLLVDFYRSSLLGYANVLLFLNQQSYFSSSQEFNFFTQTWSLGVEEQFYVIYSILICLVPLIRIRFKTIIYFIISISFLMNFNFLRFTSPEAHFFLIPFRLWEMGIGALLCLEQARLKKLLFPYKKYLNIYSGLALLAAFFLKYSPGSFPFPLLPIIFIMVAHILTYADEPSEKGLDKILTSKFLSFFGTISYSLYLIHWPAVVFTKYAFGKSFLPMTISMLVSVFLSHYVTIYFEKPMNSYVRKSRMRVLSVLIILSISIFSVSYFKKHNPFYIAGDFDIKKLYWKEELKNCVETSYDIEKRVKDCFHPSRQKFGRVIFSIGDSHAGQIGLMLKSFGEKNGYETLVIHSGDKPNSVHSFGEKEWSSKPRIFEEVLKDSKNGDIVVITFASYHMEKVDSKDFQNGLNVWSKYLKDYLEKGLKVILVIDSPFYQNYPIESCLFDSRFKSTNRCEMTRDSYLSQRKPQADFFTAVAAKLPDVKVWDMINEFCSDKCSMINNGEIEYFDYNHYSKKRALKLEPAFTTFFHANE